MIFRWLANFFSRSPWVFACLLVAFTIPPLLGIRSTRFDGSPHNIFKSAEADYLYLRDVLEDFGSDDNDCLLIVDAPRIFSEEGITGLRKLIAATREVEGVERVWSILDVPAAGSLTVRPLVPPPGSTDEAYAAAESAALVHPLVGGQLLAPSAKTTLVIVKLDEDRDELEEFEPSVVGLEQVAAELEADSPLEVTVSGIPPLRVEIFNAVKREAARYFTAGAIIALVVSWIIFRRLALVVVTSFGPLLASFWTMGMMGLLGESVNVVNVVLPGLVVIVGLTNSFHLTIDIGRSLRKGLTPREAAAEAIRHLGGACTLATVTTAIGFGSLIVSQAEIIRQFGMVCAMGVCLSLVAVLLSVPLLTATLLGREAGRATAKRPAVLPRLLELGTMWLLRYAPAVVAIAVLLTAGLTSQIPRLRPDSWLTETLPAGGETYRALLRCDAEFGGMLQLMTLVEWPSDQTFASAEVIETLEDVERILESDSRTNHPLSVLNVMRTAPGPEDLSLKAGLVSVLAPQIFKQFVHQDRHRTVIVCRLRDLGAHANVQLFDELRTKFAQVAAVHPGMQIRLTGTPLLASQNIHRMIIDLGISLGMASLVIFTTMTIAFRSLRLSLLSLIPNVFPLVATAAWLVLTDTPLQLSSVIVFTVCLGIAVDDTIHYVNRYRRELQEVKDVRRALRRSSAAVGTALVTSTLVLLAGFASLTVSEIPTSRLFAGMACLAIAAALVGDLLFLPAMLCCFAKPPKRDEATR